MGWIVIAWLPVGFASSQNSGDTHGHNIRVITTTAAKLFTDSNNLTFEVRQCTWFETKWTDLKCASSGVLDSNSS